MHLSVDICCPRPGCMRQAADITSLLDIEELPLALSWGSFWI